MKIMKGDVEIVKDMVYNDGQHAGRMKVCEIGIQGFAIRLEFKGSGRPQPLFLSRTAMNTLAVESDAYKNLNYEASKGCNMEERLAKDARIKELEEIVEYAHNRMEELNKENENLVSLVAPQYYKRSSGKADAASNG